jgi:glutamate--cysteine ligase
MTTRMEPDKCSRLTREFTRRLLQAMERNPETPRRYGFEIEFLPAEPMTPQRLGEVCDLLPSCGFPKDEHGFLSPWGLLVTFEPGGQIEYSTPPMSDSDEETFRRVAEAISETNETIRRRLGIEYMATGHWPGRIDAPLCLLTDRYVNLHERLGKSGTRGREMMKATASVHMHVSICGLSEIPALFRALEAISRMEEFRMSPQRRDIWDNTDPCRCGQKPEGAGRARTAEQLVRSFVRLALQANHLAEKSPFCELREPSFEKFLDHWSTIYTDIRFNLKGPSLEMRTPDSVPLPQLEAKWRRFIAELRSRGF